MSLNKTLAMMSAGALMLIGQSAVAQDDNDREADDRRAQVHAQTGEEQTGPIARENSPVWSAAEDEDEEDDDDDEFVAQDDDEASADDEFAQDDEFAAQEDDVLGQDDEFAADAHVTERSATTSVESDVQTDVHLDSDHVVGATDSQASLTCPPDVVVSVDQVDNARIETLAKINVEMLDGTRDLAQQLANATDDSEAQRLQLELLERQLAVIEQHGWSHQEYASVVSHVQTDESLRSRYIDTVAEQQVAGEFEMDSELESDAELEGDAEVTAQVDEEIR